jgi:hypothetical protein
MKMIRYVLILLARLLERTAMGLYRLGRKETIIKC